MSIKTPQELDGLRATGKVLRLMLDRGLAAHYEHAILITIGEPLLLTAA